MLRLVTYDSGPITISGTGATALLAVSAPSGAGLSIQSIYASNSDTITTNPSVTFEAHAASGISGGATATGVKNDGTIPGSILSTGKSGSTTLTFTDAGVIEFASLAPGAGWKITPGGADAIAASTMLVIQVARNTGATGSGVFRAVVQVWEQS